MPDKKLSLRVMRTLQDGTSVGVKAASGLVKCGSKFYVIADDQVSLAEFNFENGTAIKFVSLLQKNLPQDFAERKMKKPDWESLLQLRLTPEKQILLAVPSGSTENRLTGAFVALDEHGAVSPDRPASVVDFSKVYAALKQDISELNIEGVCVLNDKLKLFQRGNGALGRNAIIDLDLNGVIADIQANVAIRSENILAVTNHDLGTMNGKKLDFTDACVLDGRIWFLAVAEDSSSTYDDGQYSGAIVGCLDETGTQIARYVIDCATKPEGLWVEAEERRLCFYIVTDADSESVFASLYFGRLMT